MHHSKIMPIRNIEFINPTEIIEIRYSLPSK
jgi:hypothetical protein